MIMLKDLVQGSDEWIKEKLGKPSASCASQIITSQGKPSKQREGYLYTLAAEAVTGQRAETYKNEAMQEGNDREQESRDFYSMAKDAEIEQVGVIYKDEKRQFLCSPDGICNGEYGLELKNVLPKTQVKYLLSEKLPPEYFVQVQFSMFVTGFKRWDFCSYSPGLRPLIVTAAPDAEFIIKLQVELNSFLVTLSNVIKKIKGE